MLSEKCQPFYFCQFWYNYHQGISGFRGYSKGNVFNLTEACVKEFGLLCGKQELEDRSLNSNTPLQPQQFAERGLEETWGGWFVCWGMWRGF